MLSWLWSFWSTTNKNNNTKHIIESAPLLSPFIVEEHNTISEETAKNNKPVFTNEWEEVDYVRQNLRRVNSTK